MSNAEQMLTVHSVDIVSYSTSRSPAGSEIVKKKKRKKVIQRERCTFSCDKTRICDRSEIKEMNSNLKIK